MTRPRRARRRLSSRRRRRLRPCHPRSHRDNQHSGLNLATRSPVSTRPNRTTDRRSPALPSRVATRPRPGSLNRASPDRVRRRPVPSQRCLSLARLVRANQASPSSRTGRRPAASPRKPDRRSPARPGASLSRTGSQPTGSRLVRSPRLGCRPDPRSLTRGRRAKLSHHPRHPGPGRRRSRPSPAGSRGPHRSRTPRSATPRRGRLPVPGRHRPARRRPLGWSGRRASPCRTSRLGSPG